MPNLWDVDKLRPEAGIVVAGDTLPAVLWNAVAARADKVWLREKKLGIWHTKDSHRPVKQFQRLRIMSNVMVRPCYREIVSMISSFRGRA